MGPLDRLFGNGPFDLNRDGVIDSGEEAYIYNTVFKEEEHETYDEEEDLRDEIEFMDRDDRRRAIKDAGFDVDEFESDYGDDFDSDFDSDFGDDF